MAKKVNLFETARTKLDKEILRQIRNNCLKVVEADFKEVHNNIVEHFKITSENDSKYFNLDVFSKEIKEQKKIKEERAKAKEKEAKEQ